MKDMQDLWIGCHDYIEKCLCREYRQYGSCGCRTRQGKFKGTNPCQRHQRMMDDILSLSVGTPPRYGSGPQDVLEYIQRYTCMSYRSGGCNHQKCNQATELLAWLQCLTRAAAA